MQTEKTFIYLILCQKGLGRYIVTTDTQIIKRVIIDGYRSLKSCDIELCNINVLIGSNGAGKSNFISAFELLLYVHDKEANYFFAKKELNSQFFNGIKTTERISMNFYINEKLSYNFVIEPTENNTVILRQDIISPIMVFNRPAIFHFHDTSATSKIKMEHNISNNISLHQDGRNLAAFLYRLKHNYPKEYHDILVSINLVAPFFKDFVLEPNEHNPELIFLRWQKKGCADVFNPSQLSDGTLRFICLTTLLLQPTELMPSTIIIDEPELGLHPFAISIFAEMVQKAAISKQVILATQSVELLDNFDINDIIVVDNDENGSRFKRLEREQLKYWLENEYSLGELWNQNVLGGRFSR